MTWRRLNDKRGAMKHPGPWEVVIAPVLGRAIRDANGDAVLIALDGGPNGHGIRFSDDAARLLIVAAPNMLELLRLLCEDHMDPERRRFVIEEARKLIARIDGGTNDQTRRTEEA